VEYAEWAPFYQRIAAAFGFPFSREEDARDALLEALSPEGRRDPNGRIHRRLSGRDAIVVGRAPGSGAPPLWTVPVLGGPRPAVVAADGATTACLEAGIVPDVIATDLDGPVPSLISANSRGSLVVVHAHGDNAEAVHRWVPEFPGELVGSWAGPPQEDLVNPGGFTDGDRAAFLAEAAGATRILLFGFDFERPRETDPSDRRRKVEKLRWARESLLLLARRGRASVLFGRRDGTWVAFAQSAGTGQLASTQ
jgi:uncharacterized Rossmann fold enzyme